MGALLPSGLHITARLLIVPINYSANLTRATKANALSKKWLSWAGGKSRPKAPLPSHLDTDISLRTAGMTYLLRSQSHPLCSEAPTPAQRHWAAFKDQVWNPFFQARAVLLRVGLLYLPLVLPVFNYSAAKWKSSQGENSETSHPDLPKPSSWTLKVCM